MLASVDLYFSVTNSSGDMRDGERVEVTLEVDGHQDALVIPHAAVLYDIHGGTWVYEEVEDHVYTRRRVDIAFVEEDRAIVTSGLPDGTRIVVNGAAEIFGAEFGIGR